MQQQQTVGHSQPGIRAVYFANIFSYSQPLSMSSHLVAEAPWGNRHLGNLVGVILADPVLDVLADFGR